jgi:hypothetical protein
MNLETEMKKLSLALTISMLETNARIHFTRSLVVSAAAIIMRAASLDVLLIAALTLALREFVPGCADLLKVRILRRAFGNVDCG